MNFGKHFLVMGLVISIFISAPISAATSTSNSIENNLPASTLEDRAVGIGFFVWRADAFLSVTLPDEQFWDQLQASQVNHLLISLTMPEIDALSEQTGRRQMNQFIKIANRKGIKVDLLLGEPTWILADNRRKLLDIVKRIRPIRFAGLTLDLEPNQLPGYEIGFLLNELVNTLVDVKQISPWPVALTLNYKYINQRVGDQSLARCLEKAGINEITLMIYNNDPQHVITIAAPLLEAHPALKFSIAQSVEDPSLVDGLARDETYFENGTFEFQRRMNELSAGLTYANFNGIIVQDWMYYNAM
jgi:hypothetical protein